MNCPHCNADLDGMCQECCQTIEGERARAVDVFIPNRQTGIPDRRHGWFCPECQWIWPYEVQGDEVTT